jgi:uncharacterized protein YjbJ (UPF0337 family)
MNAKVLESHWDQLQGEVKDRWGQLTRDDVDRIEGSMERLTGLLQERYGYARERAEEEISRFLDELEEGGSPIMQIAMITAAAVTVLLGTSFFISRRMHRRTTLIGRMRRRLGLMR